MTQPANPYEGWDAVSGHAFGDYYLRLDECPNAPHRPPQGPNEDMAQCPRCMQLGHVKRPADETFGEHLADCSLPVDHDSYCQPGGAGHPRARIIRG